MARWGRVDPLVAPFIFSPVFVAPSCMARRLIVPSLAVARRLRRALHAWRDVSSCLHLPWRDDFVAPFIAPHEVGYCLRRASHAWRDDLVAPALFTRHFRYFQTLTNLIPTFSKLLNFFPNTLKLIKPPFTHFNPF
jgi:hypothetical protein